MVIHIVLLTFQPHIQESDISEVIVRLRSLQTQIEGIVDLACNYNLSDRGKGHQIGLLVRFVDMAALEHYGPHPIHQEVVAFMKSVGVVDIMVSDFMAE